MDLLEDPLSLDKHDIKREVKIEPYDDLREDDPLEVSLDHSTLIKNEAEFSNEHELSLDFSGLQNDSIENLDTISHQPNSKKKLKDRVKVKRKIKAPSKEKDFIVKSDEKKCKICGKVFQYLCSLTAHMANIHEKAILNSHKCDFCDLKLKLLSSVKKHMKIKHFARHKCGNCKSYFSTKLDLENHIKVKHDLEKSPICEKCDICGKPFEGDHKSEKLKVHMSVNHLDKSLRCDLCGYIFAHKESLERHVLVVHESLKLYRCKTCNDTFSQSQDLVSHIERAHQAKILSCNMCNYETKVTKNLKRHKNMIHTNDKRFGCDICEKQFKDCYILRQHMSRHYKECLLKCPFCDKGFTRNQALQRHIIDMHQFPMSKKFKCHNCNNVMSSLKYLLEHERQHCAVITSTPQ